MTNPATTTDGWSSDVFAPQGDGATSDSLRADLSGIFDTIDLPVVVVSRDFTVAFFNRAAIAALDLAPSHIGQSPHEISVLADVNDLDKLCARVIAEGAPCRRDVRDGDRWFLLRIAPYPRSDHRIGGAVLTLTNVTAFRESIGQAVYEREYTKAILNTVIEPLVVLDDALRVQSANRAFYAMFEVSREETQGVPLADLRHHTWQTPGLWARLKETLADNKEFQPFEIEHDFRAIGRRTLLLDARWLSREGTPGNLVLLALQDITERKRAEEQLRRSERELADFFDNATLGMHWVGPDGIILRANRAELNLLGYSSDEYIGHHIAEFHADKDVIEDILRRLTAGEELHEYEARLLCRDGSIKHVLIGSNVLWEDGQFIHTRCFTRDITDRKQAEVVYSRLAAIVESSDDAIISKDLDGIIRTWNAGAQRIFGYTADEIVGRPITVLIPEDRLDDEAIIVGHIRRAESVEHYETVRRRKDGKLIDISLTASPIVDGQGRVVGASKIARDITQRKRAEEAVRESERRFREMIDALPAAIYTTDAEGRVTHFNPAAVEMSGRVPELGTDQWCVSWKLYHPDGTPLPHDQCPMAIALKEGRPIRGAEIIAERPDGTRVWLTPYPTPLLDDDGRITGGINMLVNISDLKQAEKALKEADRRKDEFLATLAHELRNPLNPIRNAVELLRIKGTPDSELQLERDVIDRQVQHLTRLIDDLLDINRITRNKLELRKQSVELSDVLHAAIEMSRPLIDQFGHQLSVTSPNESVWLDADPARLSQVFMNLLNNAAKYTERGGQIWLNATAENEHVEVSVIDTGIGISAEQIASLFEMFYQADRSLDRSQSGLGIGLSLVKRLVEMHGGSVTARSDGIGAGSEFTVRLPVLVGPPPAAEAKPDRSVRQVKVSRRILVVDDNQDSAKMLATLLRLVGNEVELAFDGLEALETVERFRPEVVLLDIGMPKLDGFEACRRIRRQPWGRELLLIAQTGWGQNEDKRRTAEAGFDVHFVKPVSFDSLTQLLDQWQPVRA